MTKMCLLVKPIASWVIQNYFPGRDFLFLMCNTRDGERCKKAKTSKKNDKVMTK